MWHAEIFCTCVAVNYILIHGYDHICCGSLVFNFSYHLYVFTTTQISGRVIITDICLNLRLENRERKLQISLSKLIRFVELHLWFCLMLHMVVLWYFKMGFELDCSHDAGCY